MTSVHTLVLVLAVALQDNVVLEISLCLYLCIQVTVDETEDVPTESGSSFAGGDSSALLSVPSTVFVLTTAIIALILGN